jgi:hypothetical protein
LRQAEAARGNVAKKQGRSFLNINCPESPKLYSQLRTLLSARCRQISEA